METSLRKRLDSDSYQCRQTRRLHNHTFERIPPDRRKELTTYRDKLKIIPKSLEIFTWNRAQASVWIIGRLHSGLKTSH